MTTALSSENIPLLMISITAVVANLFVCILVFVKRQLRTRTNRFVVSLAISDILIAGILLPLCLANVNPNVIAYMGSITLLAGVANISVVTIDRYIAVFKPFRYTEIMRFWFVKIIILAWSLSIAISLIPLFWATNNATTAHHVYIFTAQIGLVVLAYVLIFIAYIRIFRKVHQTVRKERILMLSLAKSHGQVDSKASPSSSESKVARVSIIIAANFMLTWLPVEYMTFMDNIGREEYIPASLSTISLYTIALGALIDPMVYSYLKSDFRQAIKSLFVKRSRDNEKSSTQGFLGQRRRENGHDSTLI
jgi:hypothetical protein